MRTFHIGGTASIVVQTTVGAKNDGKLVFHDLRTVLNKEGDLVVMNRNGSIAVEGPKGRATEKYQVVYGAKLKFKEGKKVKAGQILVEWDPYTSAILTDVTGTVKFGDIIDGITVANRYPFAAKGALTTKLEGIVGGANGSVFLTNGSTEVIQMVVQALGGEDLNIVVADPTFEDILEFAAPEGS